MILKNEEHRKFLLELMLQVQYPGSILELAFDVKKEVELASIEAPKDSKDD